MFGTSSGEHALRDGPSLPLGTGAREGCGPLERVEIFPTRIIQCRFTPICRSRCGAGWPWPQRVLVPCGGWDQAPCAWFCLHMQIQMISWTGLCDRQRRARSAGWGVPAAGHGGPGGLRTARSRRDLSNAHYSTQIDTFDTCASRRRSRRGVRGVRPTLFNEGWSF